MFVHAGASLHGHEFSTTQSSAQQPPRRMPFLRSALRSLSDNDTRIPHPASSSSATLPRPVSFHEPATAQRRVTRPRPISEYIPKRELSVRFREPETDDEFGHSDVPASEDEGSQVSELSDGVTHRRRKRAPRKSTQFLLAHPAPQLMTKQRRLVQIRPRLLLQLQQIGEKRLVPSFDVVPSHLLAGSLIIPKLARRCPRLFRAKAEMGPNDLLIVRSEDYGTPTTPGTPDSGDTIDRRDLVAIISPQNRDGDDTAEITLEDGSIWETSLMSNGSYEFTRLGSGGYVRTARWVRRTITQSGSGRSSTSPPSSPALPEYKWTFSMINPETRRHPIMGTLMSNTLDIFDTYNTMSASSGRYPPTRPASLDLSGSGAGEWFSTTRLTVAVPEDVKLLMAITAAWVNLRQEGWPASANPKFTQSSLQRRNTGTGTPPRCRSIPARCNSMVTDCSSRLSQVVVTTMPTSMEERPCEPPIQRKTKSNGAALVKKLMTPKLCSDNRNTAQGREYVEEKPHRRLSVRQLTNKLFHRRSTAQAQQEEYIRCKLEY